MNNKIKIIYFSSSTENTKRFVEKLSFSSEQIPLRKNDPELDVNDDYVLFVPTYGGGLVKGAVPKQVIKFLNEKKNRDFCIGVITSGNTNFGEAYGLAGHIVAKKLGIPMMFVFELLGTNEDVIKVKEGLTNNWDKLVTEKEKQRKLQTNSILN